MSRADDYRIAAKAWSKADGEARQIEAMKEPDLWRLAKLFIDEAAKREVTLTITAAEREVKASPEWRDIITKTVQARERANTERGEMDYLFMKHEEEHGRSQIRAA